METPGRAVTIYVRQDDGTYKLDVEALREILNQDEVRDYPIMVVSVAGAMRQGKSFLLNLFIKYLKSGMNDEWLSDMSSKLEGFSWRGGAERDTLGILMWSEAYYVKDEMGQEVAVLLMDTQGAFDNEHTTAQSTRIITMSLMMSSLQIYNVMHSLRADKLDFFSLFVEHAKMVKNETKENVFQSLMFLVRDWPHEDDHAFGLDGGTAHIKKQMQKHAKIGKIKKKDFKEIFQNVEGFLLPYPGERVAEQRQGRSPFKGAVSDMDADFIKYLANLVRKLFLPDKVVKKAIAGAELKGYELANFSETIAALLEKKEMPEPQDLVEAQIQAHRSNMLDEFARKFEGKINEFLSRDKFVEDDVIETEGLKFLNETMEEFETRAVFGGEEAKNDCRLRLDAALNTSLEQMKIRNRDTMNKYLKKYEDFFRTEQEAIENRLSEAFNKRCVLEEQIGQACRDNAEAMKNDLKGRNFGIPQFDEEFEKKIEDLERRLYEVFVQKNQAEVDVAKSTCRAREAEELNEAKAILLKELSENMCSTKLELDAVVDRVKTQVLKKWDEELKYPDFVVEPWRKSLEENLERLRDVANDQNTSNKDKFAKDISWELSEACKKYSQKISARIGKKAHDADSLEQFHKECLEITKQELHQKDMSAQLKYACFEEIDDRCNREYEKLKTRNDEHEDQFETSCALQKSTCIETARETIKEKCGGTVLNEAAINNIYAEATHNALEAFKEQSDRGPKNVFEKHEVQLLRGLETLLSYAKNINKDNENRFMITKTTQMKDAEVEYRNAMLEKTGTDEPVDEDELTDFNKTISEKIMETFMLGLVELPLPVQNECREKMQNTLKQAFTEILRENKRKKRDSIQKVKEAIAACLEVYDSEMTEAGKDKILDEGEMKSSHEAAKQKAIEKLNRLKLVMKEDMVGNVQGGLDPVISDHYENFHRENERRKGWAENKVWEQMKRFEAIYKNEIKRLTMDRACSEEDLSLHHQSALRRVEDKVKQDVREAEVRQLCLRKVEESDDQWLLDTRNENNTKADKFEKECIAASDSALEKYKLEISSMGLFLEDDNLQAAHDRAYASALQSYSHSRLKGPQEKIDEFEQELRTSLGNKFDAFRAKNKKDRESKERDATQLVSTSATKYDTKMGRHTGKLLSESALKKYHRETVDSILEGLGSEDLPQKLKEDVERKLLSKFDTKYSDLETANSNKKIEQDQKVTEYIEDDCIEAYQDKMEILCAVHTQESDANVSHIAAEKCALDKFGKYSGSYPTENKANYKRRLIELCLSKKAVFVSNIRDQMRKIEQGGASLLKKAKEKYDSTMKEKFTGLGMDAGVLETCDRDARSKAMNIINSSSASQHEKDCALQTFDEAMDNAFGSYRDSNDVQLKSCQETYARKLQEAQTKYRTAMRSFINNECCHNLNAKHEQAKRDLETSDADIKGVDKFSQGFQDFKIARDQKVDTLFPQYDNDNDQIQNKRANSYAKVVENCLGQYKIDVQQQLRESDEKKWLFKKGKIKNFEKHHPDIRSATIRAMEGKMPPNQYPSCENCRRKYSENFKSKIDKYKDDLIDEFRKK